jgi:hypothetical protein
MIENIYLIRIFALEIHFFYYFILFFYVVTSVCNKKKNQVSIQIKKYDNTQRRTNMDIKET